MKKQSLNKQQLQLLKEFISTTEASEKQAIGYLAATKWNIQNAINKFFDDGAVPEREVVKSNDKLDELFLALSSPSTKNQNVRYMDQDQFANFNQQFMQIGDDNVVLGHIMLNVMGVQTSGHIEKHHFLKLFAYLNIGDPKDLFKQVSRLENELKNNKDNYFSMYVKLYKFYLIGNKDVSLDFDIAEQLWKVYLKPIMPLYPRFIAYLANLSKKPHKVHLDLWKMVYEFAVNVKDVSTIQESDGWPVFLDEFVEFCKSV